ncbi:hypothetical protein DVK44_10660 [Streptomyces paludis]|uniref:Uncharacterized protein n=1 Tax=Streptomyces paludis TaxID=2282738 RepID=A0A345HN16_9ACTN|nr:hypothetical protein DVK44_10660 [Streptomyces paludis]
MYGRGGRPGGGGPRGGAVLPLGSGAGGWVGPAGRATEEWGDSAPAQRPTVRCWLRLKPRWSPLRCGARKADGFCGPARVCGPPPCRSARYGAIWGAIGGLFGRHMRPQVR